MIQQESFFSHSRYRWLRLSFASVVALIIAYILLMPEGGAHGGSIYGYSVGVIATIAILYLMWYGIRRRSYASARSTMKGWLSAHIWLGISLLIVVPLHSGFQMGLNIHGAAYFLMVIVVLSGIWGAVHYKVLAPQIESHRGGGSIRTLIEQIHIYAKNISALADGKSDALLALRNKLEPSLPTNLMVLSFQKAATSMDSASISSAVGALSQGEREDGFRLVQLCEKKRDLVNLVQRELRTSIKLKAWLLLHLPLSLGLLILVFVHIFIVLLYRS